MTTEAAVAWLRKQIEGDLARWQPCADLITGTYEPEDRVADCEAKLAILDEHPGPACSWYTVRLLAGGYRHRAGYAEHWGS